MRKIIQYYSLIVALFLFSSVPSYAERAPRRSGRERLSKKEQNLKKKRIAPSKKDSKGAKLVIIPIVVVIFLCIVSSLSNQKKIFTKEERILISNALSELNGDLQKHENAINATDINFEGIETLLDIMVKNKKEKATKVLIKKEGMKIDKAFSWAFESDDSVQRMEWLLDKCDMDINAKGQDKEKTPFLFAAEKGDLGIAKLLKKRGASIHATDKNGSNALHWACYSSGSVAMVTWLLDDCNMKEKVNIKGDEQATPFLFAAGKGNLAVAKELKRRGANINAKDSYGNNALHWACWGSDSIEMVQWLLDDCNMKKNVDVKGQDQKTPFLCAAQKGNLKVAKELKRRGANINEKDSYGSNALHWACLGSGSVDMVQWLLDDCNMKKNVDVKGQDQKTPFLCAAQGGNLKVAKELKRRGANINAKDSYGNNALHWACLGSGSVDMVQWLLDDCNMKKNVDVKGQDQKTPFLCAAQGGNLKVAQELKRRGANINAKDSYGNNALHLACWGSDSIEMVKWLLDECKIGLETKGNKEEAPPFLFAAQGGNLEVAKELKKRGADINAKHRRGVNALHLACWGSDSVAMVTWLLDECGMKINVKGQYQKTPFLYAAQGGNLKVAKELKKRGANINAKDGEGRSALKIAKMNNENNKNQAMISYLTDELKLTQ